MKLTSSLLVASFLAVSTLHAQPAPTPDAGSTFGMIAVGLLALVAARRKFFK